jgi:hypothetical protein
MEPSITKSPSQPRYSPPSVQSNNQLVRLGIKSMPGGILIWLTVPCSAPLGEMFVAALQSDESLRGYVFMLPGQFVRWDDTPNKVQYKDHI